jgi:two-component system, NarL family, sensor histidine kinase DegS
MPVHDGPGPKARSVAFTVRASAAPRTNEWIRGATNLATRIWGRARAGLRLGLSRVADRALLTDVRSRAAVGAVELERARLSQDLHDDSLKALARVIHQLEARNDTVDECQILRDVAANLRDIATELHPPALADLGVVPAIESIGSGDQSVVVTSSVRQAGYERGDRPPKDVEVVVFRIVQEAVANAIAHSGCRRVRIEGYVRPGDVTVDVIDDGRGLKSGQINAAQRSGHIGVASMRRRAAIIDAELTFRSSIGLGTTVSLRWRA